MSLCHSIAVPIMNSRPSAKVTNHQTVNVRMAPARNDRIASTIVMLLESRQMVLRIGVDSTTFGYGPARPLPREKTTATTKIEKNPDSVRISDRMPTRPLRGRVLLQGTAGVGVLVGAAAPTRG